MARAAVVLLRIVHLPFSSTPVSIWLLIGPYSTAESSNSTVLRPVAHADSAEFIELVRADGFVVG
jgi:hypothetical protein